MHTIDTAYVLATIVFFWVMIGYVAACDHLGRQADGDRATTERP